MLKHHKTRFLVLACAALMSAVVGGTAALSSAGKTPAPSAISEFSVFSSTQKPAVEPEIADLAASIGVDRGNLARLSVLTSDRGRFASRLVAFPSASGGTICYALLGQTVEDPAASYCYQPKGPGLPVELAGQHFSPLALESRIGGELGVQLFGMAFDDVERMRVKVAGSWRDVPVANNGFYLDMPGVAHSQVGNVEATLSDGTTQTHDIQQGA